MPATILVGTQWGDEGKGKATDLLADHMDLVVRYQGGNNAGHTIVRDGEAVFPRGDEVLRAGDVEIDTGKMRVSVAGAQVELTPTEFQLLATLVREPGRVFTRSQLLDAVHGVAIESYERAIDAHVKNIRRKIEPTPGSPRYVLTVHGVGYRFADA